jgi:microsomal dipeptidase-like Zn-dependent dipeptidase
VVDLHVHYPMHLLARTPREVVRRMSRVRGRPRWLERLRALVLLIAARLLNFRSWGGDWRVSLDGMQRGGVEVAFSVLYQPFDELDLAEPYGAKPEPGYFADLERQLLDVEADLRALDPDGTRHAIVRTAEDLDGALRRRAVGIVHCVEGGFHLGATPAEVRANVAALAARGVRYITLAHLFYREVATNAPAIPFLPDALYERFFPQPARPGLTELGAAAVEAMYEHRVIVDISHMTEAAIDDTFAIIERLDAERDADPHAYPVIASHAGFRLAPRGQAYNVTAATVRRIADRGGVVGIILAQHQLNDGVRRTRTKTLDESMAVIRRHVDAVAAASSLDHVAIGSDLDGFIKPTMGGVETAEDLAKLPDALRDLYGADADKILGGNALRVLRAVLPAGAPV